MPDAAFAADLARYGPDRSAARKPTAAEARAYCRRFARTHYENFTVASWLLPRALRPHFHAVYAYCRWADDLADETDSPARSLELLDWWEQQLHACYRGEASHPVFVALAETIAEFDIPERPLLDLLSAFRQDQYVTRYETFDELLDYCRRSANPVGRLVLYLGRCHDELRGKLADSICTGLQLANFWQDVARDFDRGRIYLPRDSWRRAGYDEASFARRESSAAFRRMLSAEVDRAEAYLVAGRTLAPQMPRELQVDVALFIRGGLAIIDAIRCQDFDVWSRRPTVSRWDKFKLLISAWPRVSIRGECSARREGEAPAEPINTIKDSYARCQRLARRASSNFYFSFLLLPREKRRAMCALYAFLRHTDDLVDERPPLSATGVSPVLSQQSAAARRALAAWRSSLIEALSGRFHDPILPAVVDTLAKYRIPPEYLLAVIDGVEMDLDQRRYETFDELAEYCRRVASVVGQACIHVWGFRGGDEALRLAHQCGLAFQLTNILRDLKPDVQQGRVYLPQEDLRRFGYTDDDLRRGVRDKRFAALMQFEIARAEQLYDEGAALRRYLESDGRRVFAAMVGAYRGLLGEIKRRGGDVFTTPIRLSPWRKIFLAGRGLLTREG